jgi:hypothetical protein
MQLLATACADLALFTTAKMMNNENWCPVFIENWAPCIYKIF